MLLILLSWIYLFAISLVVGVSTCKLFKIQATPPIICVFIGLFFISLFIGFWAIFLAINAIFYLVLFIVSIALFIWNKTDIQYKLKEFKTLFFNLTPIFKGFISILLLLILTKCASAPFIVDNETYYIQTLKWLNEYGFTKGLTNLHFFLGQTSGWHILQSGFNFAFIYGNLNDLSGFCLLLGNFYAIEKLNSYVTQTTKNKMNLIIGLFPIFNVFLFQFIGAPSPDIAISIIGMLVFYEFVRCYKEYNTCSFYAVFILSVFAVFIKLTGLIFFVFALILYFHYYIYTRKNTVSLITIGLITFSLFVIKNTIITGNPLYPLTIEVLQTKWSLPNNISNYFSKHEKAASFGLTIEAYESASIIRRLTRWLIQGKLDTFFNMMLLLLVIITPFFIRKSKSIQILYSVGVFFILFLFFFSPQYRFYFPFLMLFSLIIASIVFKNKNSIYALINMSLVFSFLPMIYNFNTSIVSHNKNHQILSAFSLDYSIKPHGNSKYDTSFEVIQLNNTKIHTPSAIDFIWATGNIPIPALNEKQLDYLGTYFYVIPQQYSNDLKDGFYSAPITDD